MNQHFTFEFNAIQLADFIAQMYTRGIKFTCNQLAADTYCFCITGY